MSDREKKSFSELDRMRRERRDQGERRPQGEEARARAETATKEYLKEVDGLFSRGGADAEALLRAMSEARGTPSFADACRAYRESVGRPGGLREISCFLDSGDRELVLDGLTALLEASDSGGLEATSGLRTQLRMLADDSDDEVADVAEELLEKV